MKIVNKKSITRRIDSFLLLTILLALIVRIVLAFIPGFKIDVDAWFAWAIRLQTNGFANFYSDNVWTNYTPGYLYILKILGVLKEVFAINSDTFYFILKLPAIFADLGIGLLIYKIILKNYSISKARLAAATYLFNPALIFDSAIWGQIDSVLTLMLLLSVYYLTSKKLIWSSIFFALAILVKPQAVSILPLFILFIIKNFSLKNIYQLVYPGFILSVVLSIPFFGIQSIQKLFELLLKMAGDYPYTSLFAYNFWGMVGFWIKDSQEFIFTYQQWGNILYFSFWVMIGLLYLKRKSFSLYSLATLAFLSFYFLPTRVHERYLYPALPFLTILMFQYKDKILYYLNYYLSFAYLLNLYFVYIYYNHGYLKLPSAIYSAGLYNLLESYGKLFSGFSTFIFILVTISIIRKAYVEKIKTT